MKIKSLIFFLSLTLIIFSSCKNEEREVTEVPDENFDEQVEELRQRNNTVDAIEGNPELSTFATGLNTWNIEDTLDQVNQSYMVFAPNNLAYSRVFREQGYDILETSPEAVIPYHMVTADYTLEELKQAIMNANGSLMLPTFQGEEITFSMEGDEVVLTGTTGIKATILETFDIENGTAYVIDTVLLPDGLPSVTITTED